MFDWEWEHFILVCIFGFLLFKLYNIFKPFPKVSDSKVKVIETMNDLNEIVAHLGSAVLIIDFYGRWCPPCKKAAPIFAIWSNTFDESQVVFAKVDVAAAKQVANHFGIRFMPTFKVLDRRGNVMKSIVGWKKDEMERFLSEKNK